MRNHEIPHFSSRLYNLENTCDWRPTRSTEGQEQGATLVTPLVCNDTDLYIPKMNNEKTYRLLTLTSFCFASKGN